MKTRRTVVAGVTLCVLALSSHVAAQTAPPAAPLDPAAPPPAAGTPTDPTSPDPNQPLPPPAEPTSPAEPAPVPESPLLAEEPPPPPPPPEPERDDDGASDRSAGPFSRGSVRLTLVVGVGETTTDTYLILGGGPGYFILDGLEIGVDYEGWFLGDPVFHRVSPETRYVFHMVPVIKPYVGVFYRHTFVTGGFDDFDSVGARGGIYYVPSGGGLYVGGGAVYERLLDCTAGALVDCDDVYPEIFIGFSI